MSTPAELLAAAKCYDCIPPHVLPAIQTRILDKITDGGHTHGGFAPAKLPVPGGFTFSLDGTATNAVATWNAPPAAATKSEVWTSTDGITFALATTVAAPGATASFPAPTPGNVLYAKVRYCNSNVCGNFTSALSLNGYASDWAKRVVINGGAKPSDNSINASAAFINSLTSAGILTKMVAVNMLAPDSLIASITPLLVGGGNDPWTNTAFVAGDLTVNGLKGDGATKWLATGINPTTAFASDNDGGLTAYVYDPFTGASLSCCLGVIMQATQRQFILEGSKQGAIFDCWTTVNGRNYGIGTCLPGYYSGNRTGATACNFYFASPGAPHSVLASTALGIDGARANANIGAFVLRSDGVSTNFFSIQRISFLAIHHGLTATESTSFFNAVHALRVAFGGGFVSDTTTPAQVASDWSDRVVRYGGGGSSSCYRQRDCDLRSGTRYSGNSLEDDQCKHLRCGQSDSLSHGYPDETRKGFLG